MTLAPLILALLTAPAVADEGVDALSDPTRAVATYRQMGWEMHQLAKRDAWTGVERSYVRMVELGLDLSHEDHVLGATSASGMGNAAETLARLKRAHAAGESRAVIEWMYRLDTKYGAVKIIDERKRPATLESSETHFMPDANKAVQFAIAEVEDGVFEGLLPAGTYRYGRDEIVVSPDEPAELIYAKK
ncbi:MAG: hypothetical protein KC912_11565 [Proteobacteria bacterium]|nr:hypothetical protein [Pseudomonadota bacterium]